MTAPPRKRLGLAALGLAGLLGYVSGCSNRSSPPQTQESVAGPQFLVAQPLYSGKYTSISVAGDYLCGTMLDNYAQDIRFTFTDGEGQEMHSFLINDIVPEEIQPTILAAYNGPRRWVIPLMNFAAHGNGPFTIKEIGMYDPEKRTFVGNIETAEIQFNIPGWMQGWEQPMSLQRMHPVQLPQNTASPALRQNAAKLYNTTEQFVRYNGPEVIIQEYEDISHFKPLHLCPIWMYNEGEIENTKIVTRFSQLYIHGSQVYATSPLPYTKRMIIDKENNGGKAWRDQIRVSLYGIPSGVPACNATKQQQLLKGENEMLLDIHELGHVEDLNNLIPTARAFKSISWATLTVLDPYTALISQATMLPGATLENFVTPYAMKDDLEDLADTCGHLAAYGKRVRHREQDRPTLTYKDHLMASGAFAGREFTNDDVKRLEQLAIDIAPIDTQQSSGQ